MAENGFERDCLSGDFDDSADVFGFGDALFAIYQSAVNKFVVGGSKAYS